MHPLSQDAKTPCSTSPAGKPQSDQPTQYMANTVLEHRRSLRSCPKAHDIAKLELALLHEAIIPGLTFAQSNARLLYQETTEQELGSATMRRGLASQEGHVESGEHKFRTDPDRSACPDGFHGSLA